jgi:hypothetical protein
MAENIQKKEVKTLLKSVQQMIQLELQRSKVKKNYHVIL